jgi:methionyl-tRNA formyltransferase
MSKPNIIIITQGKTRIVDPIINRYKIAGIIDSSSEVDLNKKSKIVSLYSYLLQKIKKDVSLEKYSKSQGIDYLLLTKNNLDKLKEWIESRNPDLIIVYGMSFLLKKEIFNIPKYGTLNLHPSFLPSYRGPNPWFWSYYNLDVKGGVTLHYIDEGEDTGDIIYQMEYDIRLGMKSPEMQDLAIKKIGIDLITKAINNYKNLPRSKQELKPLTERARRINQSEHKQIIDWKHWDVKRIWHILRGTEMWLNALEQPLGKYKGVRWMILDFKKCDTSKYEISKIYKYNGKHFVVCIDGVVFLKLKFSLKKYIRNLFN